MTAAPQECPHCEHYTWATGHLFDTAIDLDEAQDTIRRLRSRLEAAGEALVWCLGRLAEEPPTWVKRAFEESGV